VTAGGSRPRQSRVAMKAIATSATQTATMPARPAKIAAKSRSGTEIPIEPSTISF